MVAGVDPRASRANEDLHKSAHGAGAMSERDTENSLALLRRHDIGLLDGYHAPDQLQCVVRIPYTHKR